MEAARKVSECTLLESLKIPAFTKQRLDRFSELFVALPPGPLAVVPASLLCEALDWLDEISVPEAFSDDTGIALRGCDRALHLREVIARLRAAVGGEGAS
jgi:hypothetical protein